MMRLSDRMWPCWLVSRMWRFFRTFMAKERLWSFFSCTCRESIWTHALNILLITSTETSNYSSYQLHPTEAAHPKRADHTDVTERHIREERGLCLQPTRHVSHSDLTVSDRLIWGSSSWAYLVFTSSLSHVLLLILSSPPISCLKDLLELRFISSQ